MAEVSENDDFICNRILLSESDKDLNCKNMVSCDFMLESDKFCENSLSCSGDEKQFKVFNFVKTNQLLVSVPRKYRML